MRQYYRFIKGESSLKNESINALLGKLEIDLIESYGTFIRVKNQSLESLKDSYNLIRVMEYEKAKTLVDNVNESDLQSSSDKKFFNFVKALLDFHLQLDTEENSMNRIIEIINYPQILKKDVLTFYELSGLFAISNYLIREKDDYKVAIFTYEILKNPEKHHINDMSNIITAFYAKAAKNLGIIGEDKKALEMANKGIQVSKENGTLTSLAILFHCKVLSEYNLNMKSAYQKTLIRLFGVLNVENNQKKSKFYKQIIERHFGIKESDLITYKKIKK